MERDNAIELVSKTIGNLAQTCATMTANPYIIIITSFVQPTIEKTTQDLLSRMLSIAEKNRVRLVFDTIVDKINYRLQSGDAPRRDDEFYLDDNYGQSSAKKLLESTFIKCKQEYEAKKLELFANFWANIIFENSIQYESANSLLTQLSQLSHQQLQILYYLYTGHTIPLSKWERLMFKEETLKPYYHLYTDITYLYTVRLASQKVENNGLQIGTPHNIYISPSGESMCKLIDFSQYSNDNDISTKIDEINVLIDKLDA